MSVKTEKSKTTKEKILDAALKLFNENGITNVTTAQIAKSLNMSEGNLWYHFRTKSDIVFGLFCRLEIEVDENLSNEPKEKYNVKDFIAHAARSFEYLWEYRFIYRDRYDNLISEDLIKRIHDLTVRNQKRVETILNDMSRRGFLNATPEAIHALTINSWIVQSNWLRYVQLRENIEAVTEAHIKEGFNQLIWLFLPYLNQESKIEADKYIADFSLNGK